MRCSPLRELETKAKAEAFREMFLKWDASFTGLETKVKAESPQRNVPKWNAHLTGVRDQGEGL